MLRNCNSRFDAYDVPLLREGQLSRTVREGHSLISITHFSPLENFMRRTWEFHEDKLVVKIKSLRVDHEYEVSYETITRIRNGKFRDLNWLWTAFIITGVSGIVSLLLGVVGVSNAIALWIQKAALIVAYLMFIPAFRTVEWYFLGDADGNNVASMPMDGRSKESLLEAINQIRQKSATLQEMYIGDPLPSSSPEFEAFDFDFANFLNKSTVRFYEDRLVDVEHSIAEESVFVVNYDELGEKPKVAKIANDKWDYVWSYWLVFVTIAVCTAYGFFFKQLCGNFSFARVAIGGLLLLIPLFLMRYIKREVLILSDKKGQSVFWTWIGRANREQLMQAAAFVEEKIAQNKQAA